MKLDPVNLKALKGPHSSAKDKDINNDGKVNSSDEYLHKRRQVVSKALGKLKEAALEEKKLTAKAVKNALASAKAKPKETVSLKKPPFKMEEVDLDESRQGVRVDKKNYYWGKMVIVHDGTRKPFPLHPEHQEKIKNLKDGESTTFTRIKAKVHREGDTVHLQRANSDRKTSVPYSHFAESADLDEAAKKDWDYTSEAHALRKQAEDAGIKIIRKEKYVSGKKAYGPRMPRKANVEALTRALEDLKNGKTVHPVEYWVG